MPDVKKDIIQQLQKDILLLQGFRAPAAGAAVDMGLGAIEKAFPHACFPTGAMHEFVYAGPERSAATSGFITGLLAGLMQGGKACVWIGYSRTVFPPALAFFGVAPDQIIFIDLERSTDILWAMEEALKCEGLAAVIGEVRNISFTASRRLQLAMEKSRVTGFVLRQQFRNLNTIACVARWQVVPLPSELDNNMPGVGFPRWNVELLKVRNGKPGTWQIEWLAGHFRPVYKKLAALPEDQKRKTG